MHKCVVGGKHLRNYRLGQIAAPGVVAELTEEHIEEAQSCNRGHSDLRHLLRLLGLTHNREQASDAFEHKEGEPDHAPV